MYHNALLNSCSHVYTSSVRVQSWDKASVHSKVHDIYDNAVYKHISSLKPKFFIAVRQFQDDSKNWL